MMPAFDASIGRGTKERDGLERSGPDRQDIAVSWHLWLSIKSSGCGHSVQRALSIQFEREPNIMLDKYFDKVRMTTANGRQEKIAGVSNEQTNEIFFGPGFAGCTRFLRQERANSTPANSRDTGFFRGQAAL